MNKTELIETLVEAGVVTENNKEKFEALTNPDLESIVKIVSKTENLETELGKSESEKAELITKLEVATAEKEGLESKLKNLEVTAKVVDEPLTFTPGLEFTFRKQKYQFLDTAPKSIMYGGVSRTQKELSELGEEDIIDLIGNLSLIKKIKK